MYVIACLLSFHDEHMYKWSSLNESGGEARKEGLAASTEEQLGDNVMGRVRIDSGDSLLLHSERGQ